MAYEFQVGDVVTIKNGTDLGSDSAWHFYNGIVGTICKIWNDGRVGVEWEFETPDGHDCGGTCEYGYGWNVNPEYIMLAFHGDQLEESELLEILAI